MEPERTLTDSQRDEFEDMLRALTLERSQIKEAMGFSLDNADAAGEVNYVSKAITKLALGTVCSFVHRLFAMCINFILASCSFLDFRLFLPH